jgi:trans-2,3-dihydro-3-hydroxyanthranilate isomerase
MPSSTAPHSPDVLTHRSGARLARGAPISFVRVFPAGEGGGNPAPVVLDANHLSADEMMAVARAYGHESAFVCTPHDSNHTFRFRFFVPHHEMEMCGHATLGALWLLRRSGGWTSRLATVETISGLVTARFDADTQRIEVSQPQGTVRTVDDRDLIAHTLDVLNLRQDDLLSLDIVNATTSRTKTLVPVASVERLHRIRPNLENVQALCDALDSTGLYPFAVDSAHPLCLHARQFPRSSGYPEDAATGIAAAATLYGAHYYGLLCDGATGITVMQGFSMGKPSCIHVEFRDPHELNSGCWISGAVELTELEVRP